MLALYRHAYILCVRKHAYVHMYICSSVWPQSVWPLTSSRDIRHGLSGNACNTTCSAEPDAGGAFMRIDLSIQTSRKEPMLPCTNTVLTVDRTSSIILFPSHATHVHSASMISVNGLGLLVENPVSNNEAVALVDHLCGNRSERKKNSGVL